MVNKGKAPAFMFYVKDWLSKPQLAACSPSTRGIWIDCLCYMKWDSNQNGTLQAEFSHFAQMVRAPEKDFELFLSEATEHRFCDISVTVTEKKRIVTVMSRRILRESIDRENTRLRQKRYRERQKKQKSNGDEKRTSNSISFLSSKEDTLKSTKDDIVSEGSIPKVKEEIDKLAEEFYQEKSFNQIHTFKNKMLKDYKNPRALLHALIRWKLKPDKNPEEAWGYCTNILKVEDGNYNERDYRKTEG